MQKVELKIETLIHFIESLCIRGPVYKVEIDALCKRHFIGEVDKEILNACYEGLEEKYNPNFYGMRFINTIDRVCFMPRGTEDIFKD